MISAEDLTKRRGGRAVVSGVTFRSEPGTVTGFLGPNGAGQQDKRAVGFAARRAHVVHQRLDADAHCRAAVVRGFSSGVSTGSSRLRRCSYCGGRRSASPRWSGGSSIANPGLGVASSNSTPRGSRK